MLKPNKNPVCSCDAVGTLIDGRDCSVDFTQIYASESQAQEALDYLTQKARAAESEPCQINSTLTHVEEGVALSAQFEFCCQAEAMIFQLSTR